MEKGQHQGYNKEYKPIANVSALRIAIPFSFVLWTILLCAAIHFAQSTYSAKPAVRRVGFSLPATMSRVSTSNRSRAIVAMSSFKLMR